MNFFGHATVAGWARTEPRWVMGSMLPDLLAMAGARLEAVEDPAVREGIDMHHRTDDVFHGCRTFQRMQRWGSDALEGAGVGRGTARAVAHVGTELLIDGLLIDDPRACETYLRAVDLDRDLGLSFRRGQARFTALRSRMADHGLPASYREPTAVTAHLRRILERRPRLRLADGDDPHVTGWLHEARRHLEGQLDPLLGELRRGLGAVDTGAEARAILPRRKIPSILRGRESV